MDVFSQLAPYIKDYVYRNKWLELREIQVAACEVIFNTDKNVLLASETASGKTEAAFLPVLTELYNKPSRSVGVLYISPLKALINDQFERLNVLLAESTLSVCKWHGDSSIKAKQMMIKEPQGIIQITPESLESLMIRKREACIKLFSDVRFIIIDEVHYFMASPRGIQLLSLLERIKNLSDSNPRRIGLSATLGDYSMAERWLCTGTTRSCITPKTHTGNRKLGLFMKRFTVCGDNVDTGIDTNMSEHFEYLYQQTLNKKAIIFAKAREEVELTIAHLRQLATRHKTRDIYRIHHGSISAALREEAEQDMKQSDEPIVTGATVTLELGIDIGSLDRVIQVGSPLSASSFIQRIGRCGRKGQVAELLFTFEDTVADSSTDAMRSINWEFIKTLAIIQLYLEEKWVEPITLPTHPYAIVYHQTMSYLITNGETVPALLAQYILSLDVFRHISQVDYKILLTHLLDIEHLQKTERGGLIIGRKGERIIDNYDFYSVFEAPQEYAVKDSTRAIGTVVQIYPQGVRFALAGRTWETISIDEKAHVIFVKAVSGIARIAWLSGCKAELHEKLLHKMQSILLNDEPYSYLCESSKERLSQMRVITQQSGFAQKTITASGGKKYALFFWAGTRSLSTLFFALQKHEISCAVRPSDTIPVYLEVTFDGSETELTALLRAIIASPLDPQTLPLPEHIQIPYKYNKFVPQQLLTKQFIEDFLDSQGLAMLKIES